MFLKQIEIINFKCHDYLKLSFLNSDNPEIVRKTTFMLGENGTGKSALLKAIALVTSGSSALGDLLGTPDEWIKNGKKYCEISAIITTADGDDRDIKLRINRGQHLRDIIEGNRDTLILIDNAIKKADRNYFIVGYGASRRLNKGERKFFKRENSSSRTLNIQSLFDADASLVSLGSWAMELDYSTQNGASIIRNALNQFFIENVKFSGIDKAKGRLMFSTPEGKVPLEQLSDGYQNVAAWVGDLMYNIFNTFKDHKKPLHARGVLLIDEIDLHLHPKWQRQLHTFLKQKLPNFQIIATTHSPLTAQQAEEGELYALKREGRKIELIPFKGSPTTMLVHQILMSPVFGLPTDESVKIENVKSKIRSIHTKGKASQEETKTIKEYKELLDHTPINIRSNNLLGKDDIELLKAINSELKAKQK